MASSRSDSLRSSAVSRLARFKLNFCHLYDNTLTTEQLGRATSKNTNLYKYGPNRHLHQFINNKASKQAVWALLI